MNLSLTMLLVDQTVLDEFQSQTPKKIWPVLQYSFWFTSQKMCGAFILSNYSFQFTWELKETWEKKKEWNWTNGFMWSHGKEFAILKKFFPKQVVPILALLLTYLLYVFWEWALSVITLNAHSQKIIFLLCIRKKNLMKV